MFYANTPTRNDYPQTITNARYLQFDLNFDNASALATFIGNKFRLGLELFAAIKALNCIPLELIDGGGVIEEDVISNGLWHAVTDAPTITPFARHHRKAQYQ